jgi:hypothetical protein
MHECAQWMATAATNGAVVIWNTVYSQSIKKQEVVSMNRCFVAQKFVAYALWVLCV